MAALKRNRATWLLIVVLGAGFFLLREKGSFGAPNLAPLVISAATPFSGAGGLDNGPFDSDPTVGVFQYCGDVIIAPGGSITCDEVGTPASACPINMVIQGNLVVQAGGSIHANNVGNNGGNGGDITLRVGGPNFTLCGPTSVAPECGPQLGQPAAFISSAQLGGGNGQGGDIKVLVGGVNTTPDPLGGPDIGVCEAATICGVVIPANTGDALVDTGARITSNAASGHAGDIAVYTGHDITVNGTVEARGFQGAGHGGAITLDACCSLLVSDTGFVSSQGQDPGADRVHLEACIVEIDGLVQSVSPGHQNPTPNCVPPERPGKPANSTACVEVWSGSTLTIDSTGTHKGEVLADVGFSGGTTGRGWIDLLANGNILINDGTGNDGANAKIPSPATSFAVHANMTLGNGIGGVIAVQSKFGQVSTFGNAIQANDTSSGGHGGSVTVEAGGATPPPGDVAFNTALIQANGSTGGGGAKGGGTIAARSFNGDITGTPPGALSATGGPPAGSITLTSCIGPSYSGGENPAAVPANSCGGTPTFPVPADTLLPPATCTQTCVPITPTPTSTRIQQLTPTPGFCPEDPNAVLTATVDPSGTIHNGVPNFLTLQPAYDAASNGAVIGLFGKWKENVTLGDFPTGAPKSLKITQCTSAQITAADSTKSVWNITSTGKLTIVGPDSVGGTNGWLLSNPSGGPHTLKSVRANGASIWGIRINSNGNSVSWNDVSGNGGPGGILVAGSFNTLKGGTTGPNNNDGIKITGNNNTVSGATVDGNTANGFNVTGSNNQIKSNKASLNTLDGFLNGAGSGNTYSGNSSNTGGKENGGAEYRFVTSGVDGGSNRADGVNVPSAAKGCTSFAAGQVCE